MNEVVQVKAALARFLDYPSNIEVIVVDGGSSDGTVQLVAQQSRVILVESEPGRAAQMNAGAAKASSETLLFLHVDSLLPEKFEHLILAGLGQSQRQWGRFDIRLSGAQPMFRLIGFMINLRSKLTGICTGDQAIFVQKEAFDRIGGFPKQALMEDIALSKSLGVYSKPLCITAKLTTSSRRWEEHGILRTILLMWSLRLKYFFGVKGDSLAKYYKS